jgi:hypothetical protein
LGPERKRIFLLSPAYAGGVRGQLVFNERAEFDLALKLRRESAPIGEVFSFISGLYFRGKLAYAQAFAAPPQGVPGAFVITAAGGLVLPQTPVTLAMLRELAAASIDASDARYRGPLERDARALDEIAGPGCDIVLLGSIAEGKYVQPLGEIFGERLLFPVEFVGRGDMSRGGLMLRCARAGTELAYMPVVGANRRGKRPAKLPRLPRVSGGSAGRRTSDTAPNRTP